MTLNFPLKNKGHYLVKFSYKNKNKNKRPSWVDYFLSIWDTLTLEEKSFLAFFSLTFLYKHHLFYTLIVSR